MKITYQADKDALFKKLKKIVNDCIKRVAEEKKSGKLIRIQVTFDTRYLAVEKQINKHNKYIRNSAFKKINGIEIVGKCNKFEMITEE